jgi:hypothetical protein
MIFGSSKKLAEKFSVQICSSKSQNTLNIYGTRAAGYSTLIKCRAARKCTKFKLLISRFIFPLFTSTHRFIGFKLVQLIKKRVSGTPEKKNVKK